MLKTSSAEPSVVLQWSLLAVLLSLTALIYAPGLTGGFFFDDFYNIVDNKKVYITQLSFEQLKDAALSTQAGMLRRPLSMLSFALDGYFGGITPEWLKTTNLIIHLVNGVLVFLLTRITFQYVNENNGKSYWPLLVAALWLLAPINLTGVLYVVQRMASLSALFTFSGLLVYVRLRTKHIRGECGAGVIAAVLLMFTILAAFSKENGILLPGLALCYELTVFGFKAHSLREKSKLYLIYLLSCAVLPLAAGIFILATHADTLLGGYGIRDFNLPERLLTEGRVIWLYLRLIAFPTSALFGINHDDIAISHSLVSPIGTLFAWSGIALLLSAALVLRKKQPLIALGILLFFVGHSLESTIFPLEIAHEHRNYFPSFGVFLTIIAALQAVLKNRGYLIAAIAIVGSITVTALRADLWADSLELALMDVMHHPLSPRSNYEAARQYAALMAITDQSAKKLDYYRKANELFLKSAELQSSHISGLLGSIWVGSGVNIPPDEKLISLTLQRLRSEKITPETIENIRSLNECGISAPCSISGELIYDLLLAAMSNPHASGAVLNSFMSQATQRAISLGRHQEAFDIARDAAAKDPNCAQLGLNYAALLINFKFYNEAKTELDRIATLDLDADLKKKLDLQLSELAKWFSPLR